MSTYRPIQQAFTAGEISPLFYSQQESDLYRFGLKRCRNMIPLTQGGTTSRPGTMFLGEMTDIQVPITNGRCVPIELTADIWAIALFGGGGVQVITGGSFTLDEQVVLNPDMDLGLVSWDVFTVGLIAGAEPLEFEGDNYINMQAAGDNPSAPIGSASDVRLRQEVDVALIGADDLSFEFRLVWGLGGFSTEGIVFVRIGTSAPGSSEILDAEYSGADEDAEVRVAFTWPGSAGFVGSIYIEIYGAGTVGTLRYVDVSVDYFRCWVRGIEGDTSPTLNTPYADDELDIIQFVSSPYTQSTVFVHPDHAPHELTFVAGDWVFQEIDFDHQGPGREPDWGGSNGWPAACGSFQGRLVLGASPGEPQAVWTSAPGDWYEVDQPDESPTAANPVWWTLSSRGAIRWVHGHKGLLHGTSVAEHLVSASTGLIQPGDVQATKQSAYGSSAIQPADAGELVAYVGGDGVRLRGLELNRDALGWTGRNLSWSAPHITLPGIRRIANSRDPYQILWLPLRNGALAALSYEPTYNLMGWHRHTTEGEFIDVCNARFSNSDFTFFIIKRQVEGVSRFYLEALSDLAQATNLRYLDSYKRQHLGDPTTTVDGLEHLEGFVVSIVADGEIQTDKTVLNGAIELDTAASDVTVGLSYLAEMETLPATSPGNTGGLGAQKSWAEIGVRMVNSQAPIVNGIRQEEGLDDVRMVELGWDLYATIAVEQDRPTPLTVTGIYGRLSTEDIIG